MNQTKQNITFANYDILHKIRVDWHLHLFISEYMKVKSKNVMVENYNNFWL